MVSGPLQWGRRANTTERAILVLRAGGARVLQWGRRANTTERTGSRTTGTRSVGFNGAVVRTRRRGCRGPCTPPSRAGFNGAVVRTRRRVKAPVPEVAARCVLQWGRRANTTERSVPKRAIGTSYSLQWGRRANTTESMSITLEQQMRALASMGPSCEHDGELPAGPPTRSPAISLQWGRRANTTES